MVSVTINRLTDFQSSVVFNTETSHLHCKSYDWFLFDHTTLTMQLLASLLPKLMRFLSTNRIVLKIPSLPGSLQEYQIARKYLQETQIISIKHAYSPIKSKQFAIYTFGCP